MTTTEIKSIEIWNWQWELFVQQVAKLNKKLAKYSQPLATILQVDGPHTRSIDRVDYQTFTIIIELPVLVHNGREVKFVGTVSLEDGVKKVFNNGTTDWVLGSIDHSTLKCDHCHKIRNRNTWNFFEEGTTLLHIGKACAKDYFGFDASEVLPFLKFPCTEDGTGEYEGGGKDAIFTASLNNLIRAVYIATKGFSKLWVSKEKSDSSVGAAATGGVVMNVLLGPGRQASEEEKREWRESIQTAEEEITAKGIYEEIKGYLINLPAPRNDFDWNVRNALFNGDKLADWISFFGPASYAIYSVYTKAHEVESPSADLNEFVGAEGDKVETKVVVLQARWIDSNYGGSMLYVLKDDLGHSFKTFYSGQDTLDQGSTYTIKGTVKKHETYNGRKSTVLTRIKVVH